MPRDDNVVPFSFETMSQVLDVINKNRNGLLVQQVKRCHSFWCRLRGLTFRRQLPQGRGLLLVEGTTSRLGTAIHMLAVPMALGIAWLDDDLTVVDTTLAKPWRIYFPTKPARYILEGEPNMLESLAVGEKLDLVEVNDPENPDS